MLDVINLALPFFGLIFLGYACGKLKQIPDTGLAWMNFFLIYVALPALFYRILAKTPFEQLANVPFVIATTLATYCAFAIAYAVGMLMRPGRTGEATMAGLAGRLRQHRLHGAGPCVRDHRTGCRGAGRADLLLRHHPGLFAGPVLDGARRTGSQAAVGDGARRCQEDRAAPVHHRNGAGRRGRRGAVPGAGRARPSDGVSPERSSTLRTLRARRHRRAAPAAERCRGRCRWWCW